MRIRDWREMGKRLDPFHSRRAGIDAQRDPFRAGYEWICIRACRHSGIWTSGQAGRRAGGHPNPARGREREEKQVWCNLNSFYISSTAAHPYGLRKFKQPTSNTPLFRIKEMRQNRQKTYIIYQRDTCFIRYSNNPLSS